MRSSRRPNVAFLPRPRPSATKVGTERHKVTLAICLDNEGYEASLELRKIYQALPPEANDPEGYIRIVDESGEDYLYSAKGFEIIELPARVQRKLRGTMR
jgi:hypothetical protein